MSRLLDDVFGSGSASQVLLYLQAYGSGYARGIAGTYGVPVTGVYNQLKRLEAGDVLVSRPVGNTRVFEFNMRNPTVRNLRTFLEAELALLPDDVVKAYYRERQRPRRTGKGP